MSDLFPGLEAARVWIGARPKQHLIGDAWVDAASGRTASTPNPATGEHLAYYADGSAEDVDRAVTAAQSAFATWRTLDPYAREKLLFAIADRLEANREELIAIQSLDMGALRPTSEALVDGGIAAFRYYAGWVTKILGQTTPSRGNSLTYTRREPLGVVAGIIPWNGPAQASAWKIAPALATGNTVILKPAPEAPLVSLRMAELMLEAGLPEGVLGVVTGGGAVGEALVAHEGVAKVSFTGSTATGQAIAAAAAATLKKVTLELGGKSPTIIMADADLAAAIPAAVTGFIAGAGQGCVAGTRIFAHRSVYDEVVGGIREGIAKLKPGSAFEGDSDLPPIVSARQLEKIEGYLEAGQREGATIHGGERLGGSGFLAAPALFTDVRPDQSIMREEIFGPVAGIAPFDDEGEVIRRGNDTRYGLAASIWTRDIGAGHRIAHRIEAGIVWINTLFELDLMAPFGGYKLSGTGRELGAESLDGFLQTKTVVLRY